MKLTVLALPLTIVFGSHALANTAAPAIINSQCTGTASDAAGYEPMGLLPGLGYIGSAAGACFTGIYIALPAFYPAGLLMPSPGALKNLPYQQL